MNTQEFFAELDSTVAKHDLLCHPFYKAWSAGKLTREDLRNYGREYFNHVEAFPAYLDEFASRPEAAAHRRAVLANRDEELGAGSRSHADLWLDFVEGMGGARSATHDVDEIQALIDSFHSVAREGAPEEALAAFYAYESQVPRVAAEKARGLREMYAADEQTCIYFTLHTTADIYHSRVWRNQLARIVEHDPAVATRALAAADTAAKALWTALDGIEAARLSRAA